MITQKQFMALLEPLQSGLFGFANRMLRNEDDAMDALQEMIYRLWKNRKNLKQEQNIKSYCFTMMHNLCVDQLRMQKQLRSFDEPIQFENRITDHGSRITNYEMTELIALVKEEVKTLPYKQRVIIELHDFQEFSYDEIAEMLEMEVNAIRVNLSRARAKLAKKFVKEVSHG